LFSEAFYQSCLPQTASLERFCEVCRLRSTFDKLIIVFVETALFIIYGLSPSMLKESLLVVENERLKAENERLQLKRSEEFNRLRAEVQRLKKNNDNLKADNKELERKYQRTLKQLEKYKK
jgi:predicted RNase H-like nuclease (RuvC/YqgF family)